MRIDDNFTIKDQMINQTMSLFDLLHKNSQSFLNNKASVLISTNHKNEYYDLYGYFTYFCNPTHYNNYLNELQHLSRTELKELSVLYQQALSYLGIDYQFIFYRQQKSIEDFIRETADQHLCQTLLNGWKFGDEVVRNAIIDYLDGEALVQFDLEPREAMGKTTRENGKKVYHLPRNYTQHVNETQWLNASVVLAHEAYRDGRNQGNKVNTRQAVYSDILTAKNINRAFGNSFLDKSPWLGFLLFLNKKIGSEKFDHFIDTMYASDQDYWKLSFVQSPGYASFTSFQAEVDKASDTLWELAQRLTGDGSRWQEIGRDAAGNAVNPRHLHTGDKFSILNVINTTYTFLSNMQQLYTSSGIVNYLKAAFQSVGKDVDYQNVDFKRIDDMDVLPIGNEALIDTLKNGASALVFPAHTINVGDDYQNSWIKILTLLEIANQGNFGVALTTGQLEDLRGLFHESFHVAQYEEYMKPERVDILGTALEQALWILINSSTFNPARPPVISLYSTSPSLIFPYPMYKIPPVRKTHGTELDFLMRYLPEYLFSANNGYDPGYVISRGISNPRDIISNPIRRKIPMSTGGDQSITLDTLCDAFSFYYTTYYLNELNSRSR